ncbi:DNA primase [Desulfovibrio legallii]|jgi:DNA primase|uniref:DNA primase n=1 Tax=Desulfovibrio legallii TaxID=571438 RepID=A0A1G7JPB0_9BACT|nr:DNA primase [Desulfovibrio legallii]SDF26695.1 DNA primase [Desulfovibrio legallii]
MQSKDAIRAIKERLNIVDVVRRYVELKRNGPRWMAPCPFHQETKPSFSVNEDQGLFYCFGCHASGDVFDFYSRINGLDFKETLEQLAAEAGVALESGPADPRRQGEERRRRSARQQMLRMYELASAHFAAALRGPAAAACRAYVERRGLSAEIVERFGLGWAAQEWQSLGEALRRAGFDERMAVEAGLLGRSDKGRAYDRFRGRLIFPIKNLSNQIIAFGGRIIDDADEAKYINSADTPLYKKGEHLYGLAQARRGIVTKGEALLTEGYMDVLTLHQFGYDNAVGVLGTALTPEQIKRLSGFTSKIILLFDGDRAGRKAALRSSEMLLVRGLSCQVVLLPEGEDIDSLLRGPGPEAFAQLRAEAPDGLRFCVDVLKSLAPRETVEWARNFLRQVSMPELLSPYVSRLAAQLQLSETELREGLAPRRDAAGREAPRAPSRGSVRDREILMYALRYPHRLTDLTALGADLALQTPQGRQLWDKIEQHGPEAFVYHLDAREKQFFCHCCGPEAAPRHTEDMELEALRQYLNNYYANAQRSSLTAALQANTGKGDFAADLAYLRALKETLENGHEQS